MMAARGGVVREARAAFARLRVLHILASPRLAAGVRGHYEAPQAGPHPSSCAPSYAPAPGGAWQGGPTVQPAGVWQQPARARREWGGAEARHTAVLQPLQQWTTRWYGSEGAAVGASAEGAASPGSVPRRVAGHAGEQHRARRLSLAAELAGAGDPASVGKAVARWEAGRTEHAKGQVGSYKLAFEQLLRRRDFEACRHLLAWLPRGGRPHHRQTLGAGEYATLIAALDRAGLWFKAVQAFREMGPPGPSPDARCYVEAVRALGRWEEIKALMEEPPPLPRGHRWEEIKALAEGLGAALPPEGARAVYNAAISALGSQGQRGMALALVDRMGGGEALAAPDAATLAAAVRACEVARDYQGGVDIYLRLRHLGVVPGPDACTAALRCCEKGGLHLASLKLFRDVAGLGVKPTRRALNGVLAACDKLRSVGRAFEVVQYMDSCGMAADEITYNMLISACEKAGRWQLALDVFQSMKGAGVEPSVVTYNALISALKKGGEWGRALETMLRMEREGLRPNVITYNALISACEKGGQCDTAVAVFKRMELNGILPNVVTFTAVISALDKGGQWEMALDLYEKMLSRGISANVATHTALISALGRGGQWGLAALWVESMERAEVKPNVVTYMALIRALGSARQGGAIVSVMERMRRRGLAFSQDLYSIVIDGLWSRRAGDEHARAALRMYVEAREEGGHFQLATGRDGEWKLDLHSAPATVTIVTGQGKGSGTGVSVVRDHVSGLLQGLGLPFEADPANPGRLGCSGMSLKFALLFMSTSMRSALE